MSMDRKPVAQHVQERHLYRKLWRKPWRKTKTGTKVHRVPHSRIFLNGSTDPPGPSTCNEDESWQEYRLQLFNQFPYLSSAAKAAFFIGTAIVSVPTAEILDLPRLTTSSSVNLYAKQSALSTKRSETRLKTLEEEAVSAALAAAAATAAAAAERARIAAQAALAIQAEQEMEAAKAIEEERLARELAAQHEKDSKVSMRQGGLGCSLLSKRRRTPKSRGQRSGSVQQQQFSSFEISAKRDQNAPIHSRPPPPMVSPRFAARLVELVTTAVPVSGLQYPLDKPIQPKRTSVVRPTAKGMHSPTTGSIISSQSSSNRSQTSTTTARSHRSTITNQHLSSSGQTAHQISSPTPAPVHHPSPQGMPNSQPSMPPHAYVPPGGHQLPSRCSHPTASSTNHPQTTRAAASAAHQPPPGHQPLLAHQSAPTHEPAHQPPPIQQPLSAQQLPPAHHPPPTQQPSTAQQRHTNQPTNPESCTPPAAQPPPENRPSKTTVHTPYPPSSKTPVQSAYPPPPTRTPVLPPYSSPPTNNPLSPYQSQTPPPYSYGTTTNNQERPTCQQPTQQSQPPNQPQPAQPSYTSNSNQSYQPPASHIYGTLPRKAQNLTNALAQSGNTTTSELAHPIQPTTMPHVTIAMLPNVALNQNQWAQRQPAESSSSKPRNPTQRPSSATRPSVGTLLRSGLRSLVRTSVSAAALDRSKIETSVAWNTAKIAAPADDPVPSLTEKILPPSDLSENDSSVWCQQTLSQPILPWSTAWQNQTALPVFNEPRTNLDIEQKQEVSSWQEESYNFPLCGSDVGLTFPTGQISQNLYEVNQSGSLGSLPQPYMPMDTMASHRAEWWQKSAAEPKSCNVRWDKNITSAPHPSRSNAPQQLQPPPSPLSSTQRSTNIAPATSNWLPPPSSRSPQSMWQNQSTFEDKDRKRIDVVGGPNQTMDNYAKMNFPDSMYQQAFFQPYDNGTYQQPPQQQQQHYPETVLEEASSEDPQ